MFSEILETELSADVLFVKENVMRKTGISWSREHDSLSLFEKDGGDPSKTGTVVVTCPHMRYTYTFQSNIESVKQTQKGLIYHISFPDSIELNERRKSFRVMPSKDRPVMIRFDLPDKTLVNVKVQDISVDGASFIVVDMPDCFHRGAAFRTAVTLPKREPINVTIVVKNLEFSVNMIQIGVAFEGTSEGVRRTLSEYVMNREVEARREIPGKESITDAKVCVIDTIARLKEYRFLELRFRVTRTDHFNVFAKLTAELPELVVMNCDIPEMRVILQLMRKHPVLKSLPVMAIGQSIPVPDLHKDTYTIVAASLSNKQILQRSDECIRRARHAQKLEKRKWEIFIPSARKVFVIDRFHSIGDKNFELLRKYNFELRISDHEENIIERLEAESPDIIIIDDNMVKGDPISLCKILDMNRILKPIPKIAVAKSVKNYEIFNDYDIFCGTFMKPVNTGEFIGFIHETLCTISARKRINGCAESLRDE